MRQTYQGAMECLIVDDCGTDDSMAIAERTIATYEGPIVFQVLHHERNRGLSAARNTGTLAAKGDYLYYLDSDDEIGIRGRFLDPLLPLAGCLPVQSYS